MTDDAQDPIDEDNPLRIVFSIAEASPFVKVGGLADVGAGLPRALARSGHDVRLILPGYPSLAHGELVETLDIRVGSTPSRTRVWNLGLHQGVDVFSISDGVRFRRTYGYNDDEIRPFVVFSKAVVHYARTAQPDVIHLHDWHCGFAAEYARAGSNADALAGVGTMFTIHNDRYEGAVSAEAQAALGHTSDDTSMLRRGIRHADVVSTVSSSYSDELMTGNGAGPASVELLDRGDELLGILNGVDYEDFDPATDPHLPATFDAGDPAGKSVCKFVLQRQVGLDLLPDAPLIAMVARVARQKGIDLVRAALDEIFAVGAQVIIVGCGDPDEEDALRSCERAHPGQFAYVCDSDERAARLAYAASDLFLAPSRFEPCGLGPLIALRYGAVPIVRRVGGLADTITDVRSEPATGVGFAFLDCSAVALAETVRDAVEMFRSRARWSAIQNRAMARRFSWDDAGEEYTKAYRMARARARARHARSYV